MRGLGLRVSREVEMGMGMGMGMGGGVLTFVGESLAGFYGDTAV